MFDVEDGFQFRYECERVMFLKGQGFFAVCLSAAPD
jgi:hypothetical protein